MVRLKAELHAKVTENNAHFAKQVEGIEAFITTIQSELEDDVKRRKREKSDFSL